MRKIQSRVPMLSMAEKQMNAELLELKAKAEEFQKNLEQVGAVVIMSPSWILGVTWGHLVHAVVQWQLHSIGGESMTARVTY